MSTSGGSSGGASPILDSLNPFVTAYMLLNDDSDGPFYYVDPSVELAASDQYHSDVSACVPGVRLAANDTLQLVAQLTRTMSAGFQAQHAYCAIVVEREDALTDWLLATFRAAAGVVIQPTFTAVGIQTRNDPAPVGTNITCAADTITIHATGIYTVSFTYGAIVGAV